MNTPDSAAPLASLGERGLIDRIRRRFASASPLLTVGIGDDAAVAVPPRGELEVLTTDALVEGVHFDLSFCSFADVGYKALAVNASDVAAMGATPRLALLSLLLPVRLSTADVDALLDGFAEMAVSAGVTLAGGNITTSPGPLVVDVTLIGSVRPRKVLTRAGGRPGDLLYVTGATGAAAAGLAWLRGNPGVLAEPAHPDLLGCVRRYRRPEPRVRLGTILGRSRTATACMDTSDGLADAVHQLAAASHTGAAIDASMLPIPAAAAELAPAGQDPVEAAIRGGDDYELLFSVSPKRRGRLRTAIQQARGVPVTLIGELTADPAVVLVTDGRQELMPGGFTHF